MIIEQRILIIETKEFKHKEINIKENELKKQQDENKL